MFVWAPVVVGVVTPQFVVTTISTPGQGDLEPTKHPNSLPTTALWSTTAAPDPAGYGVEYVGSRQTPLATAAAPGGVAAGLALGEKGEPT